MLDGVLVVFAELDQAAGVVFVAAGVTVISTSNNVDDALGFFRILPGIFLLLLFLLLLLVLSLAMV
jgi:hypothetical protein